MEKRIFKKGDGKRNGIPLPGEIVIHLNVLHI